MAALKDAVNCCVITLPELTTAVADIVGLTVEILAGDAFETTVTDPVVAWTVALEF
ncbi:MAG: hypothetical protein ACLQAH_13195 [Limisphaerales bacterium]